MPACVWLLERDPGVREPDRSGLPAFDTAQVQAVRAPAHKPQTHTPFRRLALRPSTYSARPASHLVPRRDHNLSAGDPLPRIDAIVPPAHLAPPAGYSVTLPNLPAGQFASHPWWLVSDWTLWGLCTQCRRPTAHLRGSEAPAAGADGQGSLGSRSLPQSRGCRRPTQKPANPCPKGKTAGRDLRAHCGTWLGWILVSYARGPCQRHAHSNRNPRTDLEDQRRLRYGSCADASRDRDSRRHESPPTIDVTAFLSELLTQSAAPAGPDFSSFVHRLTDTGVIIWQGQPEVFYVCYKQNMDEMPAIVNEWRATDGPSYPSLEAYAGALHAGDAQGVLLVTEHEVGNRVSPQILPHPLPSRRRRDCGCPRPSPLVAISERLSSHLLRPRLAPVPPGTCYPHPHPDAHTCGMSTSFIRHRGLRALRSG